MSFRAPGGGRRGPWGTRGRSRWAIVGRGRRDGRGGDGSTLSDNCHIDESVGGRVEGVEQGCPTVSARGQTGKRSFIGAVVPLPRSLANGECEAGGKNPEIEFKF